MPKVLASKNPHTVNVSSDGHRWGGIRFEDWNFDEGNTYSQWVAYGQSKTANILFTYAWAQNLGPKGLKTYTLHLGEIMRTSLANYFCEEDLAMRIQWPMTEASAERMTSISKRWSSVLSHMLSLPFDTGLKDYNGPYLDDGNLAQDEVQPVARNPEDVEKLWKPSEKLVGQEFAY
ncbi:hypothetical protein HRS9122_03760 [Pyrenophora teres f. teres]|nr:hypothetical protein HRS9122_03760 [Pyrenophora teres f. teres]